MTRDQWKQYTRDLRGPRFYSRVVKLHMTVPALCRNMHARSLNWCGEMRRIAANSAPVLRRDTIASARDQLQWLRIIRDTELGGRIT